MAYVLRPPEFDDASALGAIHVRAWQTAYRGGLMPDDYLDHLDPEERAELWRQALTGDPDATEGEVFSLNVDPDHWGRGAGTALLDGGVAALAAGGFESLLLWVHPGNERACRFYEFRDWTCDGAEKTQEVLGVTVPEVRYRRSLG